MPAVSIIVLGSLVSPGEAFSSKMTSFDAPTSSSSLKSTTLNEDGDFWIEGLNDNSFNKKAGDGDPFWIEGIDDDKAGGGGGQVGFTSILDMEYNQRKKSTLSDILNLSSPLSASAPSGNDIRIETMGGYSQVFDNSPSVMDPFPFLTRAPSVTSPMATPPSSKKISEDDQVTIEALENFLGSIFHGQVPADVIRTYAFELMAIGFDPDCEWCKELALEDLAFMKKLHQRFFWKEWEKLL